MVLGLMVLLGAGIAVGRHFGLFGLVDAVKLQRIIGQVRALPFLRLSFVAVYTVAAASGVPATALTFAGGVLFGPVQGMILNWISDMLAATLAFGLARGFHRSFRGTAVAVEEVARARGFVGLLRLRVIPLIPFAALNYGSAIYGMRWRTYLAATAIGVIPAVVVYTLLASSVVAGVAGAGRQALVTTGVCAAAVVALSFVLRKK